MAARAETKDASGKVVTAPLVIVPDETGRDIYLYRGAVVPSNADSKRVAQLVEEGMIASEADAEQALTAQPEQS